MGRDPGLMTSCFGKESLSSLLPDLKLCRVCSIRGTKCGALAGLCELGNMDSESVQAATMAVRQYLLQ